MNVPRKLAMAAATTYAFTGAPASAQNTQTPQQAKIAATGFNYAVRTHIPIDNGGMDSCIYLADATAIKDGFAPAMFVSPRKRFNIDTTGQPLPPVIDAQFVSVDVVNKTLPAHGSLNIITIKFEDVGFGFTPFQIWNHMTAQGLPSDIAASQTSRLKMIEDAARELVDQCEASPRTPQAEAFAGLKKQMDPKSRL